jgi:stress-induced morphogen
MDSAPTFFSPLHEKIWKKLNESLKPSLLEVTSEKEGHWKTTVVSESFKGLTILEKHRKVQEILKDELVQEIHALTIVAKTQEEWEKMLAKQQKN